MEALRKPWEIDLTIYGTEQELLEGLHRRDRMACTCLLKQYMPRLYRLAVQVTGDADDAQDVLQEAFMQACSRVDTFAGQGGSSLGTWLYRIVLNSALMHLRKRKPGTVSISEPAALSGQDATEGFAADMDLPDMAASPGEQVLSQELRETLDEAILDLPDSLRAAFVLRDVEGLSTAEATRMLGIGESALKVRLHRARIALRESLTPYLQGLPARPVGDSGTGENGSGERS
jgi:RNA polymerase sigma-70 factor (ECF subfamily)